MKVQFIIYGLLMAFISPIGAQQAAITRDPTQPAVIENTVSNDKATKRSLYDLQSIIIGKTRRLALINDRFVSVGDVVGDAKVVVIDKNRVVLSEGERQLTLYLFDHNIRN